MSLAKRPPLPALLIANDLLEGDVVFWGRSSDTSPERWVHDPRLAVIARTDDDAIRLEDVSRIEQAANRVIDAYLVDVTPDETGQLEPRHYRERIKTLGPSIHPHYGKQAQYGFAPYVQKRMQAKS